MLLETLSALMLASAAQAQAPPAAVPRPPLEDLLMAMRSHCPALEPKVRSAGPDELRRLEAGFRGQLSAANRSRLDQARRNDVSCEAGSDASCQANAELSAILHSDLIGVFADYVCARETAAVAPH